MDTSSPEKLWGTERKRVIGELVKGRGIATKLKNLLTRENPSELDVGVVSAEELVGEIYRSFHESLSVLNSWDQSFVDLSGQIQGDSTSSAHLTSQDSGESVKRSPVKDRRGCYKRRKTVGSWMTVSSTLEDGFAWRKYGQKGILNSKYPRCYFRCTHKNDQGCQALKQTQLLEDDTKMYNITYFSKHTCSRTDLLKAPNLISDSYSDSGPKMIDSLRRESKQEATSHEDQLSGDHIFEDEIALKFYNNPPMFLSPEMDSGYLCASTSSYGLDMETSLIRSVDFDSDFHFDENEFFGAPT